MSTTRVRAMVFLPFLIAIPGLLNACGGGDEITMSAIAPGEECIHGGVEFRIGDQREVSCAGDADVQTQSFGPGEGENPCLGEGIRVNIRQATGDPVVGWVCAEPDPQELPVEQRFVLTAIPAQYSARTYSDATMGYCQAHLNGTEFEEDRVPVLPYFMRSLETCITTYLDLAPQVTDAVASLIECASEYGQASNECAIETYEEFSEPFTATCAADITTASNECVESRFGTIDQCFELLADLNDEDVEAYNAITNFVVFLSEMCASDL